jgi:hypothetical protein
LLELPDLIAEIDTSKCLKNSDSEISQRNMIVTTMTMITFSTVIIVVIFDPIALAFVEHNWIKSVSFFQTVDLLEFFLFDRKNLTVGSRQNTIDSQNRMHIATKLAISSSTLDFAMIVFGVIVDIQNSDDISIVIDDEVVFIASNKYNTRPMDGRNCIPVIIPAKLSKMKRKPLV